MGNQQIKEKRDYGRKIDWKNAERPSPPGKPYLVPEEGNRLTDVITIRWSPPLNDGGAPIKGYVVEHRRTGSPHWLRATPNLVIGIELPLTGLEPGWRYQFRVSAENEIGRSDPGELSEPLTVTPQKWAASAPFFNIELQDTIGLENEKVEFKVQVIAVPPATISWYKDGFEIFSSRRTKIVTENDQSTFIIHQAALEDEGEIKCTATNRAGHAVTKANLKLEAPPRIRLPRQYEDGLIFEKGELIRLKVSTAGRPSPQVSWYHNGELLQRGGRYEIADSETGSSIKISDACRDDRGEYVIKGINKIGEDFASFLVTVTDRPSPPGKVQVTTFGRKVNLSWSAPEDDGGCKIGSYIVEYFRIGWDMWLKAKNCRQLSTTLDELIEGSEYKFRVRAENPYGISDPSEESDDIFIPDPKRGILKPPARKETSEVLRESKRHAEVQENKEVEESKKRRLLEEKAKKLLDTPLSVLLPCENKEAKVGGKKRTASSSESIPGDENMPPPVPRRRNKGKQSPTPSSLDSSFADRTTPSPLLQNPDRQRLTPSPMDLSRQTTTPSPIEKNLDKSRLTPSPVDNRHSPKPESFVSKAEDVENEKKSDLVIRDRDQLTNGHLKFEDQYPESPLYPRENDDSIIHGSSELMLVIYPRERSKSTELSAQQRLEIETNLTGDGVAPPMSLSAPELGCTEVFELPLMREAISSTEILYERSMARLYQDAIDEESQRKVKRRYSMDRKSVERRASLKETLQERRLSFKEQEDSKVREVLHEKSPEEETKIPEETTTSKPPSLIPKPKTPKKSSRERLSSVEKEQLEFALLREKLKKKEELKAREALLNHQQLSDTTTTTTSSSIETEELEEEYEDDEYLEEEEDYLDSDKKEEEEDFDEDSWSKPVTQVLTLPKPIKLAPFAEQEDDTYHPRSMIPTRSVFSKVEKPEEIKTTPEIIKQPQHPPSPTTEEAVETKTEEKPTKTSKIPVLSPKKTKKTSKILKKFGLKKEKKVPEVTTAPVDPNLPPAMIPKPILKNKIVKKKESPKSLLKLSISKPTDKSISEEESESEFTGRKKKQVRISEPSDEENQKKEQKPIDENAIENQVLIYHYSDIVKEFGVHKKPPARLYLNYDELKAHAKPEEPVEKVKASPKKPNNDVNVIPTPKLNNLEAKPEKPEILVTPAEEPKTTAPVGVRRASMEYVTDVILFLVACWLYLFKNELYAIPILCLMTYRQLKGVAVEKYSKIKNSITKRIPGNSWKKPENEN